MRLAALTIAAVGLASCVVAETETTTTVQQVPITPQIATLCNLMDSEAYANDPAGRAAIAADLRHRGVEVCPDKQERVEIETQ